MSPWDYSIADGSAYLSVLRYNESNRAITEEMVEALSGRPEVTSVSGLKSRELTLTAPDSLRQRIVDYYNQPYDDTMTLRDTQAAYPDWCAGLDRPGTDRPVHRTGDRAGRGVSKLCAAKLPIHQRQL